MQDSLQTRQVHDVLNKVRRQIRVNGRKHSATMHYIDNYGYIPLWILVKVLSFGIMSEFFNILKYEDQKDIVQYYNISVENMEINLNLLSNFRNVCAHEDILYDHRTQRSIPNCKYHELLNIPKEEDEYIYGKNDLFSLVIILKQMLSKEDFKNLMIEIKQEVKKLDDIVSTVPLTGILERIGFPNNWMEIECLD